MTDQLNTLEVDRQGVEWPAVEDLGRAKARYVETNDGGRGSSRTLPLGRAKVPTGSNALGHDDRQSLHVLAMVTCRVCISQPR